MATQLQIRRGTNSQVAAFTGAEGEIVVNTTNDSVHVNDGSTAGGFEMARADLNNVSDTSLNAALTGNTVSALTITTLTLGSTAITATGAELNILDGVTATATELNLLDGVTATTAELNYVDGVTSAIQTQINTKAPLASPTFTGTVTAAALTVDTTTLVVDATNNRVGVGTSSPASIIDATGAPVATSGSIIRVRNSSATASNTSFGGVLFTSSPGTDFSIGKANVNAATSLSFRNGNTGASLMELTSAGDVEVKGGNELRVYRTDNATFGSIEYLTGTGGLKFKDVNGDGMTFAGASSTYATITSAGNVGIGTSSPSNKLDIKGTVGFEATNSTNKWLAYTYTDNTLRLNYNGSGADEVVLDSSGNLGIGRDPRVMLDVAGEVAIAHNATYGLRFYNQPQNNWSSIGNPDTSSSAVLVFKAASGEGMRLDGNSNLLVGKTTTAIATAGTFIGVGGNVGLVEITRDGNHPLRLNRKSSDGVILRFDKDGTQVGTISTNANSLPSDRNFKKNIQDLQLGLNFVSSLNPVTYNYKIDDDDAPVMAGLIAQDVEAALASAGVEANSMTLLQHKPTEDDKKSNYHMDYLKLVPVLINAVKELTERVSQLENN